jgi:hypothetical protein
MSRSSRTSVAWPPIPVAFNERGLVWKTIMDLAVYLSIPQDAAEWQRALDWVLQQ